MSEQRPAHHRSLKQVGKAVQMGVRLEHAARFAQEQQEAPPAVAELAKAEATEEGGAAAIPRGTTPHRTPLTLATAFSVTMAITSGFGAHSLAEGATRETAPEAPTEREAVQPEAVGHEFSPKVLAF